MRNKLIYPTADRIAEQHSFLSPEHVDYFSIRVHSVVENTYDLVGVLNEAGRKQYGLPELDARNMPFDWVREARLFAKMFYHGITIQRD